LPKGGNFGSDVLKLAQALCGFDAVGGEAAAPTRGERETEADRGRPVIGKAMLQDVLSKNLRPARRRQLVDQVREVCKASVKFRAECLNTHWFLTLDDARHKMEHCDLRP